ncbi:Bromodomain-containing_protein [Hexamita inflata]|uniref:Bromodomain-containing protein n=1 Tax=Hexamita inflata TaxID=28002 RepID=A0AA86TNE9_9EUKA|nr:Bromodomain-containing protein [Hexamita inflata]
MSDITLTENIASSIANVIQNAAQRKVGQIFASPVNHIELGLHDYLQIVKKPMDLGTLQHNLLNNVYVKLSDFVKDCAQIFNNCRIYNGNSQEGMYMRLANECEDYIIAQLRKIKDLNINDAIYRQMVNGDVLQSTPTFGIYKIQQLVIKMDSLDPQDLSYSVQWYCKQQQIPFDRNNLKIQFSTKNPEILMQLDKMVDDLTPKKKKSKL